MTDKVPRRWLLPAVGVAAVLVLGVPLWLFATAGGGMSGGHMMGGGMAGGGSVWSFPAAFVWTVATLVLVAGGSALALSSSDAPAEEDADPVETLRQRYVAGELSEAEFERRLEPLLASADAEGVTEDGVERERARE